MKHSAVQHTLDIFRKLYDMIPPLVPKDTTTEMKQAIEQLSSNTLVTLEDVEDAMVLFGKKIWPYKQAFQELYDIYEELLAEKLLLGAMSHELKKKYKEFIAHGGAYSDIIHGGPMAFFISEQRQELGKALVDVRHAVRKHAHQAALSTDKSRYEMSVQTFSDLQTEIEDTISELHALADAEEEHLELVKEIRSHIRGFEHGFASLGPHVRHADVCAAVEYFDGRKKFKQLRRR